MPETDKPHHRCGTAHALSTNSLTSIKGIKGLKIGILTEGFGIDGGEADVDEAVMLALSVLEKAGVMLKEISIPAHRTAALAILPLYPEGTKLLYDTNLGGALGNTFYPSSIMAAFGRAKESHSHELP